MPRPIVLSMALVATLSIAARSDAGPFPGERRNASPVDLSGAPGFDPTGVTDSTAAVQAAIDSLPATGGIVEAPCGSRIKITATLRIHNLTSSGYSTRNGTLVEGACAAPASWSFAGAVSADLAPTRSVQFVWAGRPGQPMMEVDGGDGWGVRNVVFDCRNVAAIGLKVVSASTGRAGPLAALDCTTAAIASTTIPGIRIGATIFKADSLRNEYEQVYALLPKGGVGVIFDGADATGPYSSDTDFNIVGNLQVQDQPGAGSGTGVIFRTADSNIVRDLQCTLAHPASTCIRFDATGPNGPLMPNANLVDFVDWGGVVRNPVVVAENAATPLRAFNFVTNVLHVNGGDVRMHLHPKIFMADSSCSVGSETMECRNFGLRSNGYIAANLYLENGIWRYSGAGLAELWDFRNAGDFTSRWVAARNTKGPGSPARLVESERLYANGFSYFLSGLAARTIRTDVFTVNALNATNPCTAHAEGQRASVSDALNPAWSTVLVGGGRNEAAHVGARCNGAHWVAD